MAHRGATLDTNRWICIMKSMARSFSRRHGAPYVIIDGCIECGVCERVCPYDAIFMSDELEYVVDGDKCPGCRRCLDPCPVHTIIPMDDPKAVGVRESNRPFMLENWQNAPVAGD
jgi:MinD superfamily P-loop ATPase